MSFQRAATTLLLVLSIALAAGCGNRNPKLTGIQGRIVDNAGNGIAAASVLLEDKDKTVKTDSNGKYLFPNLQPGSYSIVAAKQGYLANGISGVKNITAQRTKVEVNVTAGAITTAPNITLTPGVASVDALAVNQITPQLGSGLNALNPASVILDIGYYLVSSEQASINVVLFVEKDSTHSDRTTVTKAVRSITKGSGVETFSLDFIVPYRAEISLQTTIVDAAGNPLLVNEMPVYYIISGTYPTLPTISAPKADINGIHLEWTGGNLSNIETLQLERRLSYSTFDPIATLSPLQHTFIDEDISDGITYEYRLKLTTKSGDVFTSAPLKITAPRVGLDIVMTGSFVSGASMLMDHNRNVLYVADHVNGEMKSISIDSYHAIGQTSSPNLPKLMVASSDGSMVIGGIPDTGKIVKIDPNTLSITSVANGPLGLNGLAISPDNQTVYASSPSSIYIFRVADGTNIRTQNVSVGQRTISLNNLGTLLFVLGPTVEVRDASTLQLVYTYNHTTYRGGATLNNHTDEVYFGDGNIYMGKAPWHQVDIVSAPPWSVETIAASVDSKRVFAKSDGGVPTLYIYERADYNWLQSDAVILYGEYRAEMKDSAFSADGNKVCFKTTPESMPQGSYTVYLCIDIGARHAVRN